MMLANSCFEGSLKPFPHFCIHGLRDIIILIKIMHFVIYSDHAFFLRSPMRFAHFIFLRKIMTHKITIFNCLSKIVF